MKSNLFKSLLIILVIFINDLQGAPIDNNDKFINNHNQTAQSCPNIEDIITRSIASSQEQIVRYQVTDIQIIDRVGSDIYISEILRKLYRSTITSTRNLMNFPWLIGFNGDVFRQKGCQTVSYAGTRFKISRFDKDNLELNFNKSKKNSKKAKHMNSNRPLIQLKIVHNEGVTSVFIKQYLHFRSQPFVVNGKKMIETHKLYVTSLVQIGSKLSDKPSVSPTLVNLFNKAFNFQRKQTNYLKKRLKRKNIPSVSPVVPKRSFRGKEKSLKDVKI